jgi:putative FmdB family regulatory protein
MPLYEYECEACGKRFEIIQKFSDGPPDACRVCGKGPVRRLLSSPAIQFKGTGWYITDYSQKGKSGSESGSSSETKAETKETPASSTSGDTSKPAAAPAASSTKSDTSS